MSDQLLGVLIGGLLATVGGLLGTVVSYWLGTRREKRQRAKEFLEGARHRMFGDRILRAEIEAWIDDARKRRVSVNLYRA